MFDENVSADVLQHSVATNTESTLGAGRRKLWDIPVAQLGLLLALCLTEKEFSRLLRQYRPECAGDGKRLPVAGIINAQLDSSSPFTKALGKFLDKKYHRQLRRFQGCGSLAELRARWSECLACGELAAGIWVATTHKWADVEFINRCFWELSQALARRSRLLAQAKRQAIVLEERLVSAQEGGRRQATLLEQRETDQRRIGLLQSEILHLKDKIAELEARLAAGAQNDVQRLYQEACKSLRKEQRLNQRHQQVIARLRQQMNPTSGQWQLLPRGDDVFEPHVSGEACSEREMESSLPDLSLGGRSILYVGGRSRQVARLRKLVEVRGGRFVHHDGGLHDGFSRLKTVVDCADVVLCPLDCVSHNASGHIKRCCKQANKPLCFLRTSGVSAFCQGLEKIMAGEGGISLVS